MGVWIPVTEDDRLPLASSQDWLAVDGFIGRGGVILTIGEEHLGRGPTGTFYHESGSLCRDTRDEKAFLDSDPQLWLRRMNVLGSDKPTI